MACEYHFLPGNCEKDEGSIVNAPYEERLICRPDSYVARAMIAAAIRSKSQPWGLHRLGITAHVFADTFAHQDFVGLNHPLNEVEKSILDAQGGELAHMSAPPMGHGQVNTYPDRPYLNWSYKKPQNNRFSRDDTELFILAVTRRDWCQCLSDRGCSGEGEPAKRGMPIGTRCLSVATAL